MVDFVDSWGGWGNRGRFSFGGGAIAFLDSGAIAFCGEVGDRDKFVA
ncbi:MAG: hypothetical protein HC768_23945 [Acaryochloris sp. CRU_2_0]|nr:hypothetical protein [Acaryochloris sp. CRU_2_0]